MQGRYDATQWNKVMGVLKAKEMERTQRCSNDICLRLGFEVILAVVARGWGRVMLMQPHRGAHLSCHSNHA